MRKVQDAILGCGCREWTSWRTRCQKERIWESQGGRSRGSVCSSTEPSFARRRVQMFDVQGEGVMREKRQEWIDEFLSRYRRGMMALKVLRWELEGKR